MTDDRPHYPPPRPGSQQPGSPAPGSQGPPPPPPPPGPYGPQPYQPPGAYGGPPPQQARPSPYWPVSIISLLFSCIIGAVGLYFSSQVDSKWNAGDADGARKASQTALIIGIIGIVVGVVVLIALMSTPDTTSDF